jgi:hypothetical protein
VVDKIPIEKRLGMSVTGWRRRQEIAPEKLTLRPIPQ